MAKKCIINRNNKREKLVNKLSKKRDVFRAILKSQDATFDEKMEAQKGLQALPRDSSPCRYRRRCEVTGRGKGVYPKFGLSRIKLREYFNLGFLPGVTKSSW